MLGKKSFVIGSALLTIMLGVFVSSVSAQTRDRGVYYGGSVVGGVEVNAEGVLANAPKKTMEEVGQTLAKLLEPIPNDLSKPATIRKISLKKLNDSIKQVIDREAEFPDTIRYLGGLTSIQYVVAVPEENDVVLVGSSEAWKIDAQGNVVGQTSGRPIFRLEDLLTIFRGWHQNNRPSVISCSIDPMPEAQLKISQLQSKFPVVSAQNVNAYAAAQEEAYGMNVVTVRGVPETSRFAKILVAADYKMKRIGLGQEPSPVRGLPSYVSLISGSQKQINPRFWLAPEYGTITHDSKKLTWKLPGVTVKALTDDEYVDSRSGSRQSSGKPDPAAINWCKRMDKNYDTLSKIDPVFGDLRNCMELAIVVALIQREGLLEKTNCKLPMFAESNVLKTVQLPAPKFVPSQATISRNGRSTIVACGGVEINPFTTLDSAKLDNKIDTEYQTLSKIEGDAWWSK